MIYFNYIPYCSIFQGVQHERGPRKPKAKQTNSAKSNKQLLEEANLPNTHALDLRVIRPDRHYPQSKWTGVEKSMPLTLTADTLNGFPRVPVSPFYSGQSVSTNVWQKPECFAETKIGSRHPIGSFSIQHILHDSVNMAQSISGGLEQWNFKLPSSIRYNEQTEFAHVQKLRRMQPKQITSNDHSECRRPDAFTNSEIHQTTSGQVLFHRQRSSGDHNLHGEKSGSIWLRLLTN